MYKWYKYEVDEEIVNIWSKHVFRHPVYGRAVSEFVLCVYQRVLRSQVVTTHGYCRMPILALYDPHEVIVALNFGQSEEEDLAKSLLLTVVSNRPRLRTYEHHYCVGDNVLEHIIGDWRLGDRTVNILKECIYDFGHEFYDDVNFRAALQGALATRDFHTAKRQLIFAIIFGKKRLAEYLECESVAGISILGYKPLQISLTLNGSQSPMESELNDTTESIEFHRSIAFNRWKRSLPEGFSRYSDDALYRWYFYKKEVLKEK